ncbi:MAG: hypothetical protein WBY44_13400 [Bryobacteraceae bacterium]|jgi:hypothetical protein
MWLLKIGLLGVVSIVAINADQAQGSTVVLGGAGPAPFFEEALDKIADNLTAAGVKVKIFSGEARTRTALLDEMKEKGYRNLLYITLQSPRDAKSDSARGDIVGSCFVDGKKVWDEESKSPLVLPLGVEHEIESMVNGIVKKIGKRAGGACLPK